MSSTDSWVQDLSFAFFRNNHIPPSNLFKFLPHLSPHLLLDICPPSPPIPSQCRQCPFNVFNLSSQCPQHFTPFRSQAPNEMRLRQIVKGSLPNLPLEACLSSTGWYVVWKSRRLAALSHVTIAVGAPGPVNCHRVMRGTRESVYLVYGPRSNLADLGLEWWRRYGRLHTAHTALGSVSRAPVTHGHGEGYAGRAAPRRTEQGGEILGRKCALPWELFGT